MNSSLNLAALPVGQAAEIASLAAGCAACQRLSELGFVPGNRVCPLFRAPSGDPTAYAVCGTVVALRKSEAEKIFLSSSGKV